MLVAVVSTLQCIIIYGFDAVQIVFFAVLYKALNKFEEETDEYD